MTKMEPDSFIDPNLTVADLLVLRSLLDDVDRAKSRHRLTDLIIHKPVTSSGFDSGYESQTSGHSDGDLQPDIPRPLNRHGQRDYVSFAIDVDDQRVERLIAMNNPEDEKFSPTVFLAWDLTKLHLPSWLVRYALQPYIGIAQSIVRNPNDVVMLTHLMLYFATSVPSAFYLYHSFSWSHGILHWLMQSYYVGTYTLMMHQHIHMHGILAPRYAWFDASFPYLMDPLMGHTWNSYFYHHVKHHHVEGNGPNDLSSTLRYQRDDVFDFLCYVGRFYFLIWFDLPRYFIRKGKMTLALKVTFFEWSYYSTLYALTTLVNARATLCVFILPLLLLRFALMVGNWGQHAFVDEVDPDSDFRSSITLIDVASNRFCFNDGYHTSHHLNPRRHWRDHPLAFIKQKERYAREEALVFRNIDYIMLGVRLMRKEYHYLARCLVPIGPQIGMTLDEIAAMLQTKTRRFSEGEIRKKFAKYE